jgi:transcription elongation GreA/GreB family factor
MLTSHPTVSTLVELRTDDPELVLRELTFDDAEAYYALLDRNREHLGRQGDFQQERAADLEWVRASLQAPSTGLRFGLWYRGALAGRADLLPRAAGHYMLGYWLDADLLTELRAALDQDERDGQLADRYQRGAAELRRLTWLLEHATIAEDLPDDPALVELGEAVTVQDEHGGADRFQIVHPAEAPLGHSRSSARSPLARALLGRRVGEEIEVDAPGGTYRCRILAAERAAPRRRDAGAPSPP